MKIDGRFMCAPIEAEVGPSARTREGGTARNAGWLSAV